MKRAALKKATVEHEDRWKIQTGKLWHNKRDKAFKEKIKKYWQINCESLRVRGLRLVKTPF